MNMCKMEEAVFLMNNHLHLSPPPPSVAPVLLASFWLPQRQHRIRWPYDLKGKSCLYKLTCHACLCVGTFLTFLVQIINWKWTKTEMSKRFHKGPCSCSFLFQPSTSTADCTHLINWSDSSDSWLVELCVRDWLDQRPAATRPLVESVWTSLD